VQLLVVTHEALEILFLAGRTRRQLAKSEQLKCDTDAGARWNEPVRRACRGCGCLCDACTGPLVYVAFREYTRPSSKQRVQRGGKEAEMGVFGAGRQE
jgi:hypothetical protein